jgi:hypothetical protein
MEARSAAYVEYVEGEKYAAKNAEIADTPEYFKDAGKMLHDDEVVVDIDCLEKDIIRKMISFFDINTEIRWTDRGVHLWFKKPKDYKHKEEGICALGFKVEWKIYRTTKSVTVKRNGVLKSVENEGVREELPDLLTYIKNGENLIAENELSVDHVIPWSYMFSDDLWNLVYCHKGENSEKSNRLPSGEDIIRLEERNKQLLDRMRNNTKDYDQLQIAVR